MVWAKAFLPSQTQLHACPLVSIGGVNRKDLQNLARMRLAEANALLTAGLPDGAYYLAGYAVECALRRASPREHNVTTFQTRR